VITVLGASLLNRLKVSAPQVSFSTQYMYPNTAIDALRRGEVDLALGRLPAALPGIDVETVYQDHYCVVARRGHPEIDGALSDADFMRVGHITIFDPAEGGLDESVPDSRLMSMPAFVPKWLAALTMVASSDAIVSCPRRLADRMAGLLDLQVIEMNWDMPEFEILALRLAGRPDGGLDWFAAQLRAAAGDAGLDEAAFTPS
jgi:DNA-binding transcriptional LysR family regulator